MRVLKTSFAIRRYIQYIEYIATFMPFPGRRKSKFAEWVANFNEPDICRLGGG
jgi:hypothetical protein